MRNYAPETDYHLIFKETKKDKYRVYPIYVAFMENGIRWPNLQDRSDPYAVFLDKELCRAIREVNASQTDN